MTTQEHTERELLELAAKAYWGSEIDDVCSIRWDKRDNTIAYTHADNQDHNGRDVELLWMPHQYAGDAMKLAVKLDIVWGRHNNSYWARREYSTKVFWESGERPDGRQDPVEAVCRAITRAAAQIGKDVP